VTGREGRIVSADGETLVLRMEPGHGVVPGQHMVLSGGGGASDFAEVASVEGDLVTVRRVWSNSREYFRVDDTIPMAVRRASPRTSGEGAGEGKERGHGGGTSACAPPEAPSLAWTLAHMAATLELILERLGMTGAVLPSPGGRRVNLSASGMRLRLEEPYEPGERLEATLFLPTAPPVSLTVSGEVVRCTSAPEGGYEVALRFCDLDEAVRERLIRYTLERQREALGRTRGGDDGC